MIEGQFYEWRTFFVTDAAIMADLVRWCDGNLGRRFFGVMHSAFGWRLSNWGRWHYQVSLTHGWLKIYLRRQDDIALFKLRWA